MEPPTILRIKRKRGQDPLQALILEERQSVKRSKPTSPVSSGAMTPIEEPANFYFKLTRTDNSHDLDDASVVASLLAETSASQTTRSFVIPKRQTEEDMVIPHELSDMVEDFMISNNSTTPQRRKRHTSVAPAPHSSVPDEDEYVYDVYQLATITDQNHPKSQIGYIKFFEDDDELNGSEDSVDQALYSDHEDSNAEDYYQNDYPEDEDADIGDDIHNDYGDTALDLEPDQVNELYDYVQVHNADLLDDGYVSADDEDYVFSEEEDDSESEEFSRQKFFDGESDDELAIHRDKIFDQLQRMINEEE
ncbi:hypothetical protein PSN45_000178 [Yamadazyma tenuis]|uniref:Transcription factor Iwr1 domain-containing protein n=1 Tax=Candida tenuis (strain ATCC 10573 / BCRC 21748 / CBS 615 / JCM 9827 / NBRC 10315 / NRRL Y-1498 / VKM Y-70) TaxID=590646 RepID=G3BB74_CANTC|nr:uncharacterized protein CANTEDRAFT_124262 [Yamadazyma tenuis ATCC 10573]EGV61504.1 hypothetical protein CANTEDRAFT_124262 [Yamadazyma tenuis ATCC 10573]WEJ92723.1 hypothetical protein PSN45_000178 [Yamadazyma tenuis]